LKVRLISYSQPHEEELYVGNDIQELIAYCARVSNPSNQLNEDTSAKLLNYLAKHKHWSPFEMVSACLEIETTRDIGRQILRHRSFSFQEFSQRYADPTKDLQFSYRRARMQDPKNRQNSTDDAPQDVQDMWDKKQQEVIDKSLKVYEWAIGVGIAKEQARAVLPEGNTMSRMYMNGTLRSWMHYIELRKENGTQQEHMAIAVACAEVIAKIFPLAKDL
jgi:thymidylate synthase (FAD)|tara:strand:- start:348 stop:1004 length:657 start_codon:yes stop_codon:yes gene_type:complete